VNAPAKEKKPHSLQDALRDALKRLPHDEQKRVREVLHEKGVLKDDKAG
jgi:hypothetical protein